MNLQHGFDNIETMKTDAVVEATGALAQESRLSIYRLLVKRGPEGFNPGAIIMRLAIPAPTLSFHLKQLQRAGLIASAATAASCTTAPTSTTCSGWSDSSRRTARLAEHSATANANLSHHQQGNGHEPLSRTVPVHRQPRAASWPNRW